PFISLTYAQGICGLSVEYTKYFDWATFSGCREGSIPYNTSFPLKGMERSDLVSRGVPLFFTRRKCECTPQSCCSPSPHPPHRQPCRPRFRPGRVTTRRRSGREVETASRSRLSSGAAPTDGTA